MRLRAVKGNLQSKHPAFGVSLAARQSGVPGRRGIRVVCCPPRCVSGDGAGEASRNGSGTDRSAGEPSTLSQGSSDGDDLYPPEDKGTIQESWKLLLRWSRSHTRERASTTTALEETEKVVVFGGGSFATAMGTSLARHKASLQVVMLLRDEALCRDINERHVNTRYLGDFELPRNVVATTSAEAAIQGAQYVIHAVPVQASRAFLKRVRHLLPSDVPIISVSKGIEVASGFLMSQVIPSVLGRNQPTVYLSGPSFAQEVMRGSVTCIVAASASKHLARQVQELFGADNMRISWSSDVTGVEICGALKNVLAIAAGIVEGQQLGSNALAAVISQGCAEIRWLALKMGAKAETVAGLSGMGDIMLTCYGQLSRNRQVGIRLGQGEHILDIVNSSSQVAEGVATAGAVIKLARQFRVSLPVLTAVATVLSEDCTAERAIQEIMNLPQLEEN